MIYIKPFSVGYNYNNYISIILCKLFATVLYAESQTECVTTLRVIILLVYLYDICVGLKLYAHEKIFYSANNSVFHSLFSGKKKIPF